ncbi:multidrug resistance protein MdtA precursor [Ruminiclostridium hungatei]|uniref:Multidrug resistance protein MdtA n=1 Tax=Ruminiclostridium hungatei TaxID=48256 RepID=A0A1V4SG17_RUMHU|nr:HlyD family efflux transporter periplasmic adaptor subunit [Ruminiclostridium hungatei]OPX42217.1 multidrug resistance protein MdtA precursor [Ruminiclostridium hungatei]
MQKGIKHIKWNKKRFFILSIVALVIISAAIGIILVTNNRAASNSSASAKRQTPTVKGNIEVALSGSGTVTSANTSDVMSNVQGKITKAYFKEGDKVKKGDLLFEIDDTDAKLSIQKIENQISQAQLSVSSNQKNFSNLTVTAPFDGKVTGISAKEGESAGNNTALFTITETSRLKLSVPVSTAYIKGLKLGQKAQVHLQEIMDTVEGVVTAIDDNTYTPAEGGLVRDVEITVSNPGRLDDSMTASVNINTAEGVEITSQAYPLSYANKQSVKAATSGTFALVNIKENQYVKKGEVLIRIENDDLEITSQTNDLKVQDLQNQLDAAKKQLEDYKIYSAIAGTATGEAAVAGDSVKSGQVLISIRDFDQMQFTISVDELDISKVKVGQEVAITIDALEETTRNPLTGEVIYKAMEGSASNGVATYDVKIKINETENLLAGMNANANIILSKAENVLMVPLEAITKMGDRAFVRVAGEASGNSQTDGRRAAGSWGQNGNSGTADRSTQGGTQGQGGAGAATGDDRASQRSGQSGSGSANRRQMSGALAANQEYYAGTVMKEVELGVNNDQYVEIKSGLTEGQIVVLPPLVTNSSTSNTNSQAGFSLGGFGGGFGGATRMPSGGMQQGTQYNRSSGSAANRQTNSQTQR